MGFPEPAYPARTLILQDTSFLFDAFVDVLLLRAQQLMPAQSSMTMKRAMMAAMLLLVMWLANHPEGASGIASVSACRGRATADCGGGACGQAGGAPPRPRQTKASAAPGLGVRFSHCAAACLTLS